MEAVKVDSITDDFLQNLLKGNRANCSAIARQYLAKNPSIKDLYEEVFKVSLYEIGRLWETNQITVATEHMATAIVEGILNELFEQIISGKSGTKKVVVACVENEQHQVGVKMVADVFEMKGWESFYLGTGIPTGELVRFIRETEPDLVAISLSVYFNFANLLKMLEIIRGEFPELQIVLGGQAFIHMPEEALTRLGKVNILTDLYLLEKYIETIDKQP